MLQKAFYILLLITFIGKHLPIQQIIANNKEDIEYAELPNQESGTEENNTDETKYFEEISLSDIKMAASISLKLHWQIVTNYYLPSSLVGLVLTPPPDNYSCLI